MNRRVIGFAAVALGLILSSASVRAQTPAYPWKDVAPLPQPMAELYAATIGSTIYAIGGLPPTGPLGLVYVYDASTDAWSQRKPMATAAHHLMLAPYNGKIYVFGGFVHVPNTPPIAWHPVNTTLMYDPAADAWKTLAPMPTARGAGQAVEIGGKIYVIGGATIPGDPNASLMPGGPGVVVGTCEVYNVASNSWGTCAPMPTARNHYVAGAINGKIYAVDGRIGAAYIAGPGIGTSDVTDVVEEYDPATNRWANKGRSPMARGDISGAVYNGKLYITGGEYAGAAGKMAFWAFESYDPSAPPWQAWQELPHMKITRHGFAAAVAGNTFHAIGGAFQSDGMPGIVSFTATHEAYNVGP